MQELMQSIITGISAFIATNIDDILVLGLFFAQANCQTKGLINHQANHQNNDHQFLRPQEIIAGQYLGFGVLILASLPGFLGGFIVPRIWLGWLGLVPLAIGLSSLLKKSENEIDSPTIINPITNHQKSRKLFKLINPQIYQVAAVTVGNGGDNIGIYVPLFANSSLHQLLIILAVFFIMIAIWCGIAYLFTSHPLVLRVLSPYENAIESVAAKVVPLVFIALGIYIFLESKTHELFGIKL